MSRKLARESVYKLIFEFLFSGEINEFTYEILMLDKQLDNDDRNYIDCVYQGVINKNKEISDIVSKFSIGYSINRINKADKAALFIAIYEMKYIDDIPLSVSINEAIDLVKRFSTEKSSSFVNGILASVYKEIKGDINGTDN